MTKKYNNEIEVSINFNSSALKNKEKQRNTGDTRAKKQLHYHLNKFTLKNLLLRFCGNRGCNVSTVGSYWRVKHCFSSHSLYNHKSYRFFYWLTAVKSTN